LEEVVELWMVECSHVNIASVTHRGGVEWECGRWREVFGPALGV
jgi:hypothetical protein